MSVRVQVSKGGAEVTLNPHSWHQVTNLLFLDQPVGTGMAYTRNKQYPRSDEQVNRAFYAMLLAFYKLHPSYTHAYPYTSEDKGEKEGWGKLRTTRPLILAGESVI
jgi:carboxypeptidase C (cathepsin A)